VIKKQAQIRIDDVSIAVSCLFLFIEACKLDAAVVISDFSLFFADGEVARHQIAVVRKVTGEQGTQAFDIVAPVTVQFACHAEPAHHLYTG